MEHRDIAFSLASRRPRSLCGAMCALGRYLTTFPELSPQNIRVYFKKKQRFRVKIRDSTRLACPPERTAFHKALFLAWTVTSQHKVFPNRQEAFLMQVGWGSLKSNSSLFECYPILLFFSPVICVRFLCRESAVYVSCCCEKQQQD